MADDRPISQRAGSRTAAPLSRLVRAVGVATIAPVALGVAAAPLLARAMSPADRGRLAAMLAAITIATVVALGGIPQQLPRQLALADRHRVWQIVVSAVRRVRLAALCTLVLAGAVAGVFLAESWAQVGLLVAVIALWWMLGVARAALVGVGEHTRATGTYLHESFSRVAMIVLLVATIGDVGVTEGLVFVGGVPALIALVVVLPELARLRSASDCDAVETLTEPREPSSVTMSVAQQFMGRSVLAVWALTLVDSEIGLLVVGFAVTEMMVNFARVAQPHIIHQAETGRADPLPWIAVLCVATLLSIVGGVLVVPPLFGDAYAAAVDVVVPLAVAQGAFAATVVLSSVRFVSDQRATIRTTQSWQLATVVVTVAVGAIGTATSVANTFALFAIGQMLVAIRWWLANRESSTHEPAPAAVRASSATGETER